MTQLLGERAREILNFASGHERPLLAGRRRLSAGPRRRPLALPVHIQAADLFAAVWNNIATAAASLDLVRGLRDAGYGVYPGTNQVRRPTVSTRHRRRPDW
ncbi:hypothetical protein ACFT2C_13390 [Promicromonospora sp. NPDC057138]|uniref:hypothetical protein n=1 Tax=Promicromonospora sp. NPDC057138 TaxID=3346031 RepID=UPI0036438C8F